MSHITHIEKLKLEIYNGVVLLRGVTRNGDALYAYVKVDNKDIEDMQRAYEEGRYIDYSQYKGIIKNDWGEEPPENVKKYMEKTFNFTHLEAENSEN